MFYRGENYFILNFQNLYLDKLPQRNRNVTIRLSSSDFNFFRSQSSRPEGVILGVCECACVQLT